MGIGKDIFGCRYFGFQGCLGYDYDKETKELVINEEEAKVVRFIFESYNQGKGARLIGKELKDKGYKTKRGSNNWPDSTIRGILKNEKYRGDLLPREDLYGWSNHKAAP